MAREKLDAASAWHDELSAIAFKLDGMELAVVQALDQAEHDRPDALVQMLQWNQQAMRVARDAMALLATLIDTQSAPHLLLGLTDGGL